MLWWEGREGEQEQEQEQEEEEEGVMVHCLEKKNIKIQELTWHSSMDMTARVSRMARPILNKYIINNK